MSKLTTHHCILNYLFFIFITCILGLHTLLAGVEAPRPISTQDYCHFLNSVGSSDPYSFYEESMDGIIREGVPGNYSYSVSQGKENQLIFCLSWHNAACSAHWNKQGEEDFNDDDLNLVAPYLQTEATTSDQELKSNLIHFFLVNDEKLPLDNLPPKEKSLWISYMMIPILFLGEEGNPEDRVLPHDEESSHLKEKARENITEPLALSNANISPLLSQVLRRFIENANRIDNICKKKKEYQQELKILSPDSNRALMLNDLIPTLEKAISHQDTSTGRLIKNIGTSSGSEKEALKTFRIAEYAMMINDRPNKIERIVNEIEQNYKHLAEYQHQLSEVQAQIERQPPPRANELAKLNQAHGCLRSAYEKSISLINRRVAYAKLLPFPYDYEKMDEVTKTEIEEKKWNIIKEEVLARRKYILAQLAITAGQPGKTCGLNNASFALLEAAKEAKKPAEERNEEVIKLFKNSARLSEEAANAWDLNQFEKADDLWDAGAALLKTAEEAQKPAEERNEEVIQLFKNSARLCQEAANAWDGNQPKKSHCLQHAGIALFETAKETQEPAEERNEEVKELFQESARLFQEADNTCDLNQSKKAYELNHAGIALFEVAKEAKKPTEERNEEVIQLFKNSARLCQEAVNIRDLNQLESADDLHIAGIALFEVAKEAKKPAEERNEEVIKLFKNSARLCQEAVNAWDLNQFEKADDLWNAGFALFEAAEEAQEPNSNHELIASLRKEAEELEEQAKSFPNIAS